MANFMSFFENPFVKDFLRRFIVNLIFFSIFITLWRLIFRYSAGGFSFGSIVLWTFVLSLVYTILFRKKRES